MLTLLQDNDICQVEIFKIKYYKFILLLQDIYESYIADKAIYGIMVDGTQYISEKEQESIVIRFIDDY